LAGFSPNRLVNLSLFFFGLWDMLTQDMKFEHRAE